MAGRRSGLSRRQLLTLGAAGGALLAGGAGLGGAGRPGGGAGRSPRARRLRSHPPEESWDRLHSGGRDLTLVPGACGACAAGCGTLVWVDRATLAPRRIEGNPLDPATRGRLCARGVAALGALRSTDRVSEPMRRTGPRGDGRFEPVSWDAALGTLVEAIRAARAAGEIDRIALDVDDRAGEEPLLAARFRALGLRPLGEPTGRRGAAAFGARLTWGASHIGADLEAARVVVCVGNPWDGGGLFVPQAAALAEARLAGARLVVLSPHTWPSPAGHDLWLPAAPGSETALLLALAYAALQAGPIYPGALRAFANWRETLAAEAPTRIRNFSEFAALMRERHATYSLEYAAAEGNVQLKTLREASNAVQAAEGRVAVLVAGEPAASHMNGFEMARAALFLAAVTGAIGGEGGATPGLERVLPFPDRAPAPPRVREYGLSDEPIAWALPHLVRAERLSLRAYVAHGANPVYAAPDGGSWRALLLDAKAVPLSVALTPAWNETAELCDLVLPSGLPEERTGLVVRPTRVRRSVTLRQDVRAEAARRTGRAPSGGPLHDDLALWLEVGRRLGVPGPASVEEAVREALAAATQAAGLEIDPAEALATLRRRGTLPVGGADVPAHLAATPARAGGIDIGAGVTVAGFPTPSRRIEIYSPTLAANRYRDHALPAYHRSHVHPSTLGPGEICLLPLARTAFSDPLLPTPWLAEEHRANPLWVNPGDAPGFRAGTLCRVRTELGYLVTRVLPTDLVRSGVAVLHQGFGRWRTAGGTGWPAAAAAGAGSTLSRRREAAGAPVRRTAPSEAVLGRLELPESVVDPDPRAGASAGWIIPVQLDPASGQPCWAVSCRLERPQAGDQVGDISVDLDRAHDAFLRWLSLARPAEGAEAEAARRWLWAGV